MKVEEAHDIVARKMLWFMLEYCGDELWNRYPEPLSEEDSEEISMLLINKQYALMPSNDEMTEALALLTERAKEASV